MSYREMKTTLEIPDALFRRAKSIAAERGIPFRELVSEALAEKVGPRTRNPRPWIKLVGKLSHLGSETRRIQAIIDEEFEKLEPEDWL